METFLEIIREILKGIVREVAVHLFRKNVLDKNKSASALLSDVWTGALRTEIKETRRTRQRDSMLTYRREEGEVH